MTINIGIRGETETEQLLSNFAATPFTMDGWRYASVEGFWQSLKFPREKDRRRVAAMSGVQAKLEGKQAPKREEFEYQGRMIEVGSPEHHQLMRTAIKRKLRQNPKVLKLLLETGDEEITHILIGKDGRQIPDSKSIPGKVFSRILMDLRTEFRAIHGDGSNILM